MREMIRKWLTLPTKSEIKHALWKEMRDHVETLQKHGKYVFIQNEVTRELEKLLDRDAIETTVSNYVNNVVADKILDIAADTALYEVRQAAENVANGILSEHATTVEAYVHSPEFIEETIEAINDLQLKR